MKDIINKILTMSEFYKDNLVFVKIKDEYVNIKDIAIGETYRDYNGYNEGEFKVCHKSKVIKENEFLKREIEKLKLRIQELENEE